MKLRCYSENRIGRAWLKKERGGGIENNLWCGI